MQVRCNWRRRRSSLRAEAGGQRGTGAAETGIGIGDGTGIGDFGVGIWNWIGKFGGEYVSMSYVNTGFM